jgi:HPt (histidine-containing phosphotransfer) domain-containing protein
MDDTTQPDVEAVRTHIRAALRDVNDLVSTIERDGLPEGTHALASALRSRLDDLCGAIDGVLNPGAVIGRSVHAPVTASSAPVDEAALAGLVNDLGDASRVSYLVQLFLTELHTRRLALSTAADQGDVASAKAVSHTLKSSALLLGAGALGNACDQLTNNDDPAALRGLVDEVLTHATAAARWFQIWISNQPVNP